MKKLLKYLVYVSGGGLLIILIAYFGLIGWLQWKVSYQYSYNSSALQGEHTTDTTPIPYQIGSYRFNIPVNYVLRRPDILRSNVIKSKETDVISVLWSDLEPYTNKSRAKFDQRRGIENKIFLSLVKVKWYQPKGEFDPSTFSPYKIREGTFIPEHAFYMDIYNLKQKGIEGTCIHDDRVPQNFIYYPTINGDNEKKPILGNIYAVLDEGHYLYS